LIKEPQIVVHEADEPDFVGNLFDANVLTGKTWLRLILRRPMQIRPQVVTVTVRS
jgi:hypothetical protein